MDIASYVGGPPAADSGEKEHVLVCLKIAIGKRQGVMLLDPGYHVARVVTVMHDKLYPHTGWFVQSDEPNCKKEYNYSFCSQDSDYVEWHERETRPGLLEKIQVALIYVARPYLTAIDVTERRNLVYTFRSLLARDTKGFVTSGMYFTILHDARTMNLNLFYLTANGKKRIKMPFSKFANPSKVNKRHIIIIIIIVCFIDDAARDNCLNTKFFFLFCLQMCLNDEEKVAFGECARQLGMTQEDLEKLICQLTAVVFDAAFIAQLISINTSIDTIAEDN